MRGLRIHVRERGPEGGRPCVLLHGWLDQGGAFDRLAPLLAQGGAHTFALDLRGHGDSGWVGPGGFYHLAEHVADLDGALDALGLGLPEGPDVAVPRPVDLVGHSLGATVCLLYAAVRPGRVRHLTLLDGLPLPVKATEVPDRMRAYLDDLKTPRRRRLVESLEHAAQRVQRANAGIRPDAALHLARSGVSEDPEQGGRLAWKWDPWQRVHSPLPLVEEAVQELLGQVVAPMLILRAGTTWLPEEPELRERLARVRGAIAVETLPGTSHHLHVEEPARVATLVQRAWEQLPK